MPWSCHKKDYHSLCRRDGSWIVSQMCQKKSLSKELPFQTSTRMELFCLEIGIEPRTRHFWVKHTVPIHRGLLKVHYVSHPQHPWKHRTRSQCRAEGLPYWMRTNHKNCCRNMGASPWSDNRINTRKEKSQFTRNNNDPQSDWFRLYWWDSNCGTIHECLGVQIRLSQC